ncbi:MAG: hypothetical protein QOE70_4268 [Chthoniobacter sp.]|nr:hypothetical protein [Chthoniobacter sp.]
MPDATGPVTPPHCRECGTELAAHLRACPACGALVFVDELKRLALAAQRAATPVEALGHWRQAYALLPTGSRQQEVIAEKIKALIPEAERASGEGRSKWGKAAAGAGAIGVMLAKFKFVIFFLLTKAKLLLLGLTKMSTLFSMLLSFGLYWTMWGWKFAAGLILSIYVHEMGHVAMLSRLGIHASAPMFIPGFGAIVRLREALPTAREDARVGLAGPIWGLGAALAAWGLSIALQSPLLAAVAQVGAWINLFNLTPVWQLDGARGWRAFSRRQRWIALATVIAALFLSTGHGHGVLFIVVLGSLYQLFSTQAPVEPDPRALAEYVCLIASLTALTGLPVAV